jgi:A/G-specific adenine glycosylase
MPKSATSRQPKIITGKILRWYDRNRRVLPWRALPGHKPDPYRVWLSEIMLQQTTVVAVEKYFARFLRRFPDLPSLAQAELAEVLALWQGLGYYARARNLHACARVLCADYGGKFPGTKADLLALPGIGDYTAGAIAAIAFNRVETAMDANIERVMARLYAVTTPLPRAKAELKPLLAGLLPENRPGDFIQALMDLGADICKPARPDCARCPIADVCVGRATGIAAHLPHKAAKKTKPQRAGWVVVVRNRQGQVLLRRRAGKTMLGEMVELPSSAWDEKIAAQRIAPALPKNISWELQPETVRHSFTHFDLTLWVYTAKTQHKIFKDGFWCEIENLRTHGIPSLFQKVLRLGGIRA